MEFEIYAYPEHSYWEHFPIDGGVIIDKSKEGIVYYWVKKPFLTLVPYSTVNTWPVPRWYPNVSENGETWEVWASVVHGLENISPASKIFFVRQWL